MSFVIAISKEQIIKRKNCKFYSRGINILRQNKFSYILFEIVLLRKLVRKRIDSSNSPESREEFGLSLLV